MAESVGTLVADLQIGGIAKFQSGLKKAGSGFAKLGTAAKIAGGLIAGAIAVKAVQAFASGVASAIEFQKAMAEVATLTNATAKETQVLADTVSALSSEFASPAVETAAALYQTISAGFSDAADSSKILEASLKLAIGGVTNTTTAVDGLTTILNSYQLSANQATSVSDKLFVAMRAGKTTIAELSSAMGMVTSISAALGVSLDSTLAAVSALTTGGKRTKVAVTELRQVFVNILKPTAQAAKLSKSLGIEFNAAALKSKGLVKFLEDVKRKTGGSTEALSLLFGSVEAVGAVLSLTGPQMETFNKIQGEMGVAAGATSDAVQTMRDTTDFKLDKLNESWESFKRTLADAVVPAITTTVEVMNKVVKAADATISKLRELSQAEKVYADMAEAANKASAATKDVAERTAAAQKELAKLGLTGQEIEEVFLNQSDRVNLLVGGLEGLEAAVGIVGGQAGRTSRRVVQFGDALVEVAADSKKVKDAIADVLGETGGDKATKSTEQLRKEMERLEAATKRAEQAAEDFLLAFEKTAGRATARALTGLEPARDIQVDPQTITLAPAGFQALEGEIDQRVIDIGGTLTPDFDALDAEIARSAEGASLLQEGLALSGAQVSGVSAALATGNLVGAAIALAASTGALDEVMQSVSLLANALIAPFGGLLDGLSAIIEVVAVIVTDALVPLTPLLDLIGSLLQGLSAPLRIFGDAVGFVSKILGGIAGGILSVFIVILRALDAIPLVPLTDTVRRFERQKDALTRSLREQGEEPAAVIPVLEIIEPPANRAAAALENVADSAETINSQFRQLPTGFKLQKAIFDSITGLARPEILAPAVAPMGVQPVGPAPGSLTFGGIAGAAGLLSGASTEERARREDRARLEALGITPFSAPVINIENMEVVTPDASGLADELTGLTARTNVLQSGSATPAGEAAFSGSP